MATKHAVAAKSGRAIERLNSVKAAINKKLDIEDTTIPAIHRDPDLLRALQLEALAGWSEKVADALGIKVEKPEPFPNAVLTSIHPVGDSTPPNVVDEDDSEDETEEAVDTYDSMTVPELT